MSDGMTDGERMSHEARKEETARHVDAALGAVGDLECALKRSGASAGLGDLVHKVRDTLETVRHDSRICGPVATKRTNDSHIVNLMALAQSGRVYEHYKGGRYTCVGLFLHHDTREWMVAYVSHKTGETCVRELSCAHKDSWTDTVTFEGRTRLRFEIVSESQQPR